MELNAALAQAVRPTLWRRFAALMVELADTRANRYLQPAAVSQGARLHR